MNLGLTLGLGSRAASGGGGTPTLKLAGSGLRLPTATNSVSGNNYRAIDYAIGMPDVEVDELYFFFPTFYCTNVGEFDCGNGYTIEGIGTCDENGARILGQIDDGSGPIVIDPAQSATQYGRWVKFTPASPIPANAVQRFSFAYFCPDGLTPAPRKLVSAATTNMFGDEMPVEKYQNAASSMLSTLSDSTSYNNQNGAAPPVPVLMMVPGVTNSFLGLGDSIDYGSQASSSAQFFNNRMAHGFFELALNDGASSGRLHGCNISIPGWNFTNTETTGSHGNVVASTRQLWAFEKARTLNGDRPIADMIWSGHGQNSSTTGAASMITSARSLASIWRTAIGNAEAPLHWVGMPAATNSSDGWQTTANQTPRTSQDEYPTGGRWVFNDAIADGGDLRTDGTVQSGTQLYPVSSLPDPDRGVLTVRPASGVVTTSYTTGGGNVVEMDTQPAIGAWLGFIDPSDNSVIGSGAVRAVSGSGPYSVTVPLSGDPSLPLNTIVQEWWTDGGVHHSPIAHVLYADPVIDTKVALGFVAPPDVTAPTITSSATVSVAEDVVLSHTLTADESVAWSIVGGADQAQLEISTSTLRWSSNGTRDFENPADADTDNDYVVTVRATDSAGNTTDQTITVTVTDAAEPDNFLTQGATAGYFEDPSNVPASTSRITFRGTFTFAGSVPNLDKLFSQTSTGCDLETMTNGRLRATVEDGTGAKMLSSVVVAPNGSITPDTEHSIVFDVDHVAGEVSVTIDGGTPIVTAFTATGNGVFQSSRNLTFLALSGGGAAVPAGTIIKDLSVDLNGTLHKAIPNNAAAANADAWHQGGNFT